jgi:LysM repeat protein
MRRFVRPVLLLTGTAFASSSFAATTPRGLRPGVERHHDTRRARSEASGPRSLPRREPAEDPACPIEQPQLKQAILTHRVKRGDSLSAIAQRYGTSVRALAAANGLGQDAKVHADQLLVIPHQHRRPGGGDDWLKYARTPQQPGHLELYTYTQRFVGPVIVDGKVQPAAKSAISSLLGVKGSRPALSERLLRLLVRVSDTFGGRAVRVVSGFRTSSYYSDSRHRRSEAVDFSIPGVPNEVVRQYLLLLADVGVGYYPNSSFLHLDVRSCPMQWTDYAGPGEPPRHSPRRTPQLPRNAQAESPGGPAEGSHAQAEGSHAQAESSHAQAESSHAQAESSHDADVMVASDTSVAKFDDTE